MSIVHVPWRRPMDGRDPEEQNRTATPLELFLDLCFVVAVATMGKAMHHDIVEGVGFGLVEYLFLFFALWWAWVGYAWFASAYDSGDVTFRLVTFATMASVLVFSAGIPAATGHAHDVRLVVVAYVAMRLIMVPMWLRVANEHEAGRRTAVSYAGGVSALQALWLAWLLVPHGLVQVLTLCALVVAELALPWYAEREADIPFHPEHIAERHHLFAIICLGEVVLATSQAINGALEEAGFSGNLVLVATASLLLVFSMWWLYFKREMADTLREAMRVPFEYAHYFVFGAIAMVGVSLSIIVDQIRHRDDVSPWATVLMLASSACVYLLGLTVVHALADRKPQALVSPLLVGGLAIGLGVGATLLTDEIGLPVMLVALVLVGAVVHHQLTGRGGVVFEEERPNE